METQAGQPQDKTGPSLWSVFVGGGVSLTTTKIPLSAGFSLRKLHRSRRPAERRPCVSIVTVTMAPEAWI